MLDQEPATDEDPSTKTTTTTTTSETDVRPTTDETDSPVGTSGTETDPRSIAKDDAFHLLQNSRRRAVLRHLLAHPDREQFRMRDVAEAVAAWEHDTTVEQLMSDQRQRVYIGLYQSHLPKLDDHGVIDYNQSRGIVEPTPLIAALAPFLEDGLDADTQRLTAEDTGRAPATAPASPNGAGLVPSLTSLFAR